MIFDVCI